MTLGHPVPAEAPVKQPQCDVNQIEVIEVVHMNQEHVCKDDPRGVNDYKNEVKKPNCWSCLKQVRESNIHTL